MTPDEALRLISEEMVSHGYPPPPVLTVEQSQRAFAGLQLYAQATEMPLAEAVRHVARFQMQSIELAQLRRQS